MCVECIFQEQFHEQDMTLYYISLGIHNWEPLAHCFRFVSCCRSCGKIFCSDCSEFFAPVPDERLYEPVRLCGPCYLLVTSRIQVIINIIIQSISGDG